jgi:hypothetical protein
MAWLAEAPKAALRGESRSVATLLSSPLRSEMRILTLAIGRRSIPNRRACSSSDRRNRSFRATLRLSETIGSVLEILIRGSGQRPSNVV